MGRGMTVTITVNGETRQVDDPPMTSLTAVLRERLGLTGTKLVCGEGFCGACQVEVDGAAVPSCLVPVGLLDGRTVRTVEGRTAPAGALDPIQQAFKDTDAVQCGMCFPGMATALGAFLRDNPDPAADEVREHLAGNICRCTGYQRIIESALAAARAVRDRSRAVAR
jgi:carbon-monoxide dehydrogenase small subunit